MSDVKAGQLVKSLAGHDKNHVYVVLRVEGTTYSLADGRLKLLSNPKKKNRKHLQPIHKYASELLGMNREDVLTTDEQIKRSIKLYHSNES